MDKNAPMKLVDGEWCMGEFQGLMEEAYDDHGQVGRMEASFACDCAQEVADAVGELTDAMAKVADPLGHLAGLFVPDVAGHVPEDYIEGKVVATSDMSFSAHLPALQSLEEVERLQTELNELLLLAEVDAEGAELPQVETDTGCRPRRRLY